MSEFLDRDLALVGPEYHPVPKLLHMSADQILSLYKQRQQKEFMLALTRRTNEGGIEDFIPLLKRYALAYPALDVRQFLDFGLIENVFHEVHDHVMAHPVWVHPFFRRFASGNFTTPQLQRFAAHYFNQVKNTRQCVALALGRFDTLMNGPEDKLISPLSEVAQVVLAGVLADEYGVKGHEHGGEQGEDYSVDFSKLFSPTTHPALYRRFLDALNLDVKDHDVSAPGAVIDNILVQRILAGDPSYDHLEALASVGLGMEWGVPVFFSMIIAGVLKHGGRTGANPSPAAMEIWSAHVHQDVAHAISMMIATVLYMRSTDDLQKIKNSTTVLMTFRYQMMSSIYEVVFEEPIQGIDAIELPPRFRFSEPRLPGLLVQARKRVRPSAVTDYPEYVSDSFFPRALV